jgi:hypothetical protein
VPGMRSRTYSAKRRPMAKLIIIRPMIHWIEHASWARRSPRYEILIDGQRTASIGLGQEIELELAPGHHQVRARSTFFGSQPVDIDAALEETRVLAVCASLSWQKLHSLAALFIILSILPMLGLTSWLSSRGPQGMVSALDNGWLNVIMLPGIILPVPAMLLQFFLMVFLRNRVFEFVEIPGLDLNERQIADLLRSRPFRVRITIRHLMIGVAVLAVFLAVAVGWTRHERSNHFRSKASLHANLAGIVRQSERDSLRFAVEIEKAGLNASRSRHAATKAAARADYHEAMRRKYEQAALQGRFYVEPDPPAPPWP